MDRRRAQTYYQLLQVDPGATAEVIRAAYRALMGRLQCHPDLGGDPEIAILINEAYATLTDPGLRAEYDREIREGPNAHYAGQRPSALGNSQASRREPRRTPLPKDLIILNRSISQPLDGRLLDLSTAGARLRLRETVTLGQAILLQCPEFAARGTVAWHRPAPAPGETEVGLRLTDFDLNTGALFVSSHA